MYISLWILVPVGIVAGAYAGSWLLCKFIDFRH